AIGRPFTGGDATTRAQQRSRSGMHPRVLHGSILSRDHPSFQAGVWVTDFQRSFRFLAAWGSSGAGNTLAWTAASKRSRPERHASDASGLSSAILTPLTMSR